MSGEPRTTEQTTEELLQDIRDMLRALIELVMPEEGDADDIGEFLERKHHQFASKVREREL